jgi:NAD(P) transhydrogenase subunit alpha
MVESMKQGSVIVDLAAEQGGNCEVTRPGESYEYKGVRIIGYTDLPSRMANQSSQLYGTNLWHLLSDMGGSENFKIDWEDEVVRGALVAQNGEVVWELPKPARASCPQQCDVMIQLESKVISICWLICYETSDLTKAASFAMVSDGYIKTVPKH